VLVSGLLEPESFTALAKLTQQACYNILSDHLGTSLSMHQASGEAVWSAGLDSYGQVRNLRGKAEDCPFRFPGQYEDVETGLYYNRFRYYDPKDGMYVSQEPIGLLSGEFNIYAYVSDPNFWLDLFGLAACPKKIKALQEGPNGTIIIVKSKKEADELVKAAFPGYSKVRGIGPQDAVGIRRKRKMDRFKQGGAYHKDYAIDPQTGRVRGHLPDNLHGEYPHINIKREDGMLLIINIVDQR
jgi:RHS repeat-associated protein